MNRSRTRAYRLAIGFPLAVALACGGGESVSPPPPSNNDDLHANAIAYLDRAIDLMQTRAFYRRRVKWDSVRAAAHTQAGAAITPAETYTAITQSLRALNDHHSFLQRPPTSAPPASADLVASVTMRRVDSIDGDFLDDRFGYVHVPTFSPLVTGANGTALADSLQALIRKVDANSPCGWIVDLRHNSGGNMWPMLAGVGPILGNDERAGFFVDADSLISTWFYANGAAGIISPTGARGVAAQISRAPYTLKQANSPVAVLTDSLTASSGEAITVAFRGLARARSFGGATAGVPTANAGFPLSDGAMLFLMTALDADRTMRWYSERIVPDEPLFLSTYPATDDAIVVAAKNWLKTRPPCAP